MTALPPGSVIGMLGGGQLGRMTALAAAKLGYHTHVFAPALGPATQVTDRVTLAAYEDEAALADFAAAVDVVTYEFENVPAATADFLASRVAVRPGPHALAVCQDRVREKSFLAEIAVLTTRWWPVDDVQSLARAVAELGGQGVLKTARGGYDGKGQTVVSPSHDLAKAWAAVAGERTQVSCILEAFVDFELEASVVVARGLHEDVAAFDLGENEHRDHILHRTIVPARVSPQVRAEALRIARRVAEALDYVGVMGIEVFVTRSGDVLVNELAPRPHNSGHWTQDGALTCQFEQQARAVCGLPLGSPRRLADAVMTNLIGQDVLRVPELLADPENKVHLYGKIAARPGRKMGHVNRLSPARQD